MKPFTVIGYYEDNGQIFAHHVLANYPSEAFYVAAMQCQQEHAESPNNVVYVAALEGHQHEGGELFFPGEGGVDGETVLDQPDVFGGE